MKRYVLLKKLVECVQDELIVTPTAPTSHELFVIKDLPTSFYMRHSLGMSSSIGLGLALAKPDRRVIVIEGDGGLLMNLGSLATIATQNPKNFVMFVLDNRCYEMTGAQATATAYRTQLDQVAEGAGIEKVYRWRNEADVDAGVPTVLKEEGPVVVVVEIEKGRETTGEIKIRLIENKIRFMKAVGSR